MKIRLQPGGFMVTDDVLACVMRDGRKALEQFVKPHEDGFLPCGHLNLRIQKALADNLLATLEALEALATERMMAPVVTSVAA